jgi:hypothetical protein
MPAETHQLTDERDADSVLDLLAAVLGADPRDAAEARLPALGLDDDLSVLHLWELVVEEFGERSVGEFEPGDERPATLGELAALFSDALHGGSFTR